MSERSRPVIVLNARFIFLLLALVCFLLKAFGVHVDAVDMFYLGLAFVVAAWLF